MFICANAYFYHFALLPIELSVLTNAGIVREAKHFYTLYIVVRWLAQLVAVVAIVFPNPFCTPLKPLIVVHFPRVMHA